MHALLHCVSVGLAFPDDASRALVEHDDDCFADMEKRSFSRNMDCFPVGKALILRGYLRQCDVNQHLR
jgi:hypothetical protein